MVVLQAALGQRLYVMTRPPVGELRTDRVEAFNQLDKITVAHVAAIIDAESGERIAGPHRPINAQGAQRRAGEIKPKHISFVSGHLLEIEKEGARGLVPGEYVPTTAHDEG